MTASRMQRTAHVRNGNTPHRPGNRLQNRTMLILLACVALLFFIGIVVKVGLFGI